ncbi:hypothetical protein CEP52_006880 [Fusarium oligoseptatum]|uniref:UvrD-like helicase C-terminal domain-containing protein n=1 Tax=Fusarium oligoseptatum TaxID=2604345 RepID=A0A428TQM9_9HYPO|nr:hypothetical protein CEP52_006880 [Fusarium oligoseptatum]
MPSLVPIHAYLHLLLYSSIPTFYDILAKHLHHTAARARLKPCTAALSPRVFCLRNPLRTFTDTRALLQRHPKTPPFAPSDDQQKIAKLCRTENVVVSARPGSGKTSTAEAIVAAHPDLRVLVLTYSKRLQLETLRRLRSYLNCEVYTFHSMGGRLFGTQVSNDAILSKLIQEAVGRNELPQWSFEPFDIIVLDEFQDCTDSLFWLTTCFIQANQKKAGGELARLVVLGDERQAIYGFRGADDRYLTLAPELFGPVSPYTFAKVPLCQSFRLSEQSARFINNVFLGGEQCITSNKIGPKPIVLKCAPFDSYSLAKKLWPLIKHYGAENTAILSPSVRQNGLKRGPLKKVVNMLSKRYGVPIHVPPNEEASLNDKVIDGKLCVSTIHQFKGNERDLVIVFGTDASYFEHFGRHLPDDRCPNEIFVALTRAKEQLVLIHHEDRKLMPFASVKALYETADVTDMTKAQRGIEAPGAPGRPTKYGLALPRTVAVRDMVRHIKDECLEKIIQDYLHIRKLPPLPEDEHIKLRDIVPSDEKLGFYEEVSDLNGLVVVAAFEHEVSGTLDTLELDPDDIEEMPAIRSQQGVSWLCRQACKYEAKVSGYDPRKIQMKHHDFDWIKPDNLDLAQSRLQGQLRDSIGNLRFEAGAYEQFRVDTEEHTEECCLLGRADIVAVSSPDQNMSDAVWEIKFVSQLSNQHVIQACAYAYLLRLPHAILYNVRTGEKWEITQRDGLEGLRRLIEEVLKLKYTTEGRMSDEEFTEKCARQRLEILAQKRELEDTLGPIPKLVSVEDIDPDRGHYPNQPYIKINTSELTGAPEILFGYVSFEPPTTIKKGNSSMADNWDRYVREGRDDKEKAVWKKYAGNLSTTESTEFPGNNKLAKENRSAKGAWALWTLLKKQHRKADLTKWPLDANGPTNDPDFVRIWDVDDTPLLPRSRRAARRRTRRRKPGSKTGKKEANANANAQRSTGDLTEARTGFLDDLRNTVAGVAAEKVSH